MSQASSRRTTPRSLAIVASLTVFVSLVTITPPDLPARAAAGDVTIEVFDRETGQPIDDFRFIINEDIAHSRPSDPLDYPDKGGPESFSPVVAKGDQDSATVNLPDGKYLVSVIGGADAPAPGEYKMSGTHFEVDGNEQNVRVDLIPNPLPTSSIKVVVHHDNHSVNGAIDIPQEQGLEGFAVLLEDGTGEVSVDFYGNPICTDYQTDNNGEYLFDTEGLPIPVPDTGGQCLTDENGEVTIPFLAAHKYGVFAVPPDGSGWIQTSTIEGTHVVDAWVEEGNNGLLSEFGASPVPLVQLGYVQECDFGLCPELNNQGKLVFPKTPTVPQGSATIMGTVREAVEAGNEFNILTGKPVDRPYIALNNLSGNDEQIYTGRGNPDGTFSIPNVPPGTYQVVIWDKPQLFIISFETAVVVENGDTIDMGDILVPRWFGQIQGFAYLDNGETKGGTAITAETITALGGEVGPDPVRPGWANGFRDCLPDQDSGAVDPFDYDNCEPGLPNQDFVVHFNDGSVKYGAFSDSNGYYSIETHFPFGHYMIWEVGFGRNAQMYTTGYFTEIGGTPDGYPYNYENKTTEPQGASLLQAEITLAGYYNWIDTGKLPYSGELTTDYSGDGPLMDYKNGGISGVVRYGVTRNEFDPRLAAAEDYEPGVPNVTVNLYQAALDANQDPISCTVDPETPEDGCPYGKGELMRVSFADPDNGYPEAPLEGNLLDSVASDSYWENRPSDCEYPDPTGPDPASDPACHEVPINIRQIQDGVFDGGYAFDPMPVGSYIVEMVAPDNYRHIKEEDQNTDQGDDFIPAVPPPPCAGPLHLVNDPRNPADGQMTPLCDSKFVQLTNNTNPAADFYLMVDFDDSVDPTTGDPTADFAGTTEVPQPGLIRGTLFDDLNVQFDTNSYMFGGKKGVPNTPIGILDYQGNELAVTYSDDEGFFEVLLPSTYTRLCPTPGGVCAGMYLLVGNYPGQDPDPSNALDGWNPNYQTLTVTIDVWSGKTTYADVAILPKSGFGFVEPPLCLAEGPMVDEVTAVVIERDAEDDDGMPIDQGLTILGSGFGGDSTVTVGGTPVAASVVDANTIVVADIGSDVPLGPQQLLVSSGDLESETGITIHVTGDVSGNNNDYLPGIVDVYPDPTGTPLQDGIDLARTTLPAGNGRIVRVHPGIYFESPIVASNMKLQGFGPGVTSIDGRFLGFGAGAAFDFDAWTANLPDVVGPDEVPAGQVVTFVDGTGMGYGGAHTDHPRNFTQLDGFTIIGGDSIRANLAAAAQGGGVYVHAFVAGLQVSNNLIQSNAGNAGGGVILGQPYVGDNQNDDIRIHHNRILNNGGTILAGGIGIFNGADNYLIDHNVICGNTSAEYGGGISHFGESRDGVITDNRIVFNSAFDEGGAIMIAGEQPLDPGTLSEGSGPVEISGNLIQHNLSNDDGGGIRLLAPESDANGANNSDRITIFNNMIVNNVATDIGGGIALDDAPDTRIFNNTVARNISTATAEDADTTSCSPPLLGTCPHGAGITSTPHSAALAEALADDEDDPGFSDPVMFNNIIFENEAFYRDPSAPATNPLSSAGYIDLEVVGGNPAWMLTSVFSLFSGDNPAFVDPIPLLFRATPLIGEPNFWGVQILATPADNQGDYHLGSGSDAIDAGAVSFGGVDVPDDDFDGDARPFGGAYDIGADEAP